MKGFTLLSAVALTTMAFTGAAFAQKSVSATTLTEEGVRTLTLTGRPTIHRIDLRGDFQPAGATPDPYLYLQTMFARWNDAGSYIFSYFTFAGGRTLGDDVVLLGGAPDPGTAGYDTTTPVACISEITFALISVDPIGGDLALRLDIHPWNGVFGTAAGASIASATLNLTIPPVSNPPGFAIFLITVPVQPSLPVPKAFWVAATPDSLSSTINLANIGPMLANSTPGNVSMLPGRGYFRAATPPTVFTGVTAGSVFTTLPQGSFYLAIRGTHNFAGTVDMSALNDRAKPSDPLAFEFDDDPTGDPDEGIEEALRRNIVDVEVVNDSGATPFTSRFTTYLDENGRFTLPVSAEIASVTVRRWDNGLKVTFNRPAGGWSTDSCNPTAETQTMTFGDVNGDGIIDDADLLAVLFGFGSGE
ncbi:MAG: hypothetical protein WHS44_11525 [Fimbriimonadales bacterium]|nr:MAG: hypothetical protein KatS3mg018_0058 [Fimbriimonadales bacterium]